MKAKLASGVICAYIVCHISILIRQPKLSPVHDVGYRPTEMDIIIGTTYVYFKEE